MHHWRACCGGARDTEIFDCTINIEKVLVMPGKGHRFTTKQDRQAKHIAASERAKGFSPKEAKSIGYATVNKQKHSKRGKK